MNGMAKWEETGKEFYVEQTGVVADALQEALVQDYDGLIQGGSRDSARMGFRWQRPCSGKDKSGRSDKGRRGDRCSHRSWIDADLSSCAIPGRARRRM